MAGHSKWANIKHRKGRQDALRGKIATKIAREITVAVRLGGADPALNMKLKLALQKAKENFEQHVDEKLDWLRDRVKMDLEKIVQQEEIMTFFKTQSVMEKLKEDDEELDFIISRADKALYIAKKNRNKSVIYHF